MNRKALTRIKELIVCPGNNEELNQGKIVKIKGFPQEHKVKLFRVEVSTHRTDYVVTNDLTQDSIEATHQTCGF
jgi:hypothetical protein